MTVPIGVIGVIFESRPDALVQIASLCLKSGNAVILKGGSEARHTNRALFELIRAAVEGTDPRLAGCLQLVETREEVRELLELTELIDLLIPRGSNELVRSIQEGTRIPVLGHSEGVCHLYVDRAAELAMAVDLAWDAKCQYPAVCNAIETLLVHRDVAAPYLPRLAARLAGVELRGDEATRALIPARPATRGGLARGVQRPDPGGAGRGLPRGGHRPHQHLRQPPHRRHRHRRPRGGASAFCARWTPRR